MYFIVKREIKEPSIGVSGPFESCTVQAELGERTEFLGVDGDAFSMP